MLRTPESKETSDGFATVASIILPANGQFHTRERESDDLTVISNKTRAHPFSDHWQPEADADPSNDLHSCLVDDA